MIILEYVDLIPEFSFKIFDSTTIDVMLELMAEKGINATYDSTTGKLDITNATLKTGSAERNKK